MAIYSHFLNKKIGEQQFAGFGNMLCGGAAATIAGGDFWEGFAGGADIWLLVGLSNPALRGDNIKDFKYSWRMIRMGEKGALIVDKASIVMNRNLQATHGDINCSGFTGNVLREAGIPVFGLGPNLQYKQLKAMGYVPAN